MRVSLTRRSALGVALVLIASLLPIALPASADEVVVRSGLVDIVDVRNVDGEVRVDTLHNGNRHPVGEVIVAAGPNSQTRFTRQMAEVLDRSTFDVEEPEHWSRLDEHHEIWRKRVGRDVWVIPATPTAGLPRIGFSTMNFSPHIDDWRTQLYSIDGPGDVLVWDDTKPDAPFVTVLSAQAEKPTQVVPDLLKPRSRQTYSWAFTEPGVYVVDVHLIEGIGVVRQLYQFAIFVGFDGTPPPPGPFADVAGDHLFVDEIAWLAATGITRGCNPPNYTRFCPEQPVTREQMASFLVRATGLESPGQAQFTDVAGDSPHTSDIAAIAAVGITRGCNPPENDLFCPGQPVTRAQMASFLVRTLGLEPTEPDFVDVSPTNAHRRDIAALAEAGITRGCNPPANDRFCPTQPVTRAQMAAFIHRAAQLGE